MKINAFNPILPSTPKITTPKATRATTPEKQFQTQSIEKPDLHNMSPDELRSIAKDLYESGKISDDEAMQMSFEGMLITFFGEAEPHQKIDMIAYLENHVENLRQLPGATGIEHSEHILELLKGLDASWSAQIPQHV